MTQLYELPGGNDENKVKTLDKFSFKKNVISMEASRKKWTSMQSIPTDHNKAKNHRLPQSQNEAKKVCEESTCDDLTVYNGLKSARIVKKLKQKFDNQPNKSSTFQPTFYRPKSQQISHRVGYHDNQLTTESRDVYFLSIYIRKAFSNTNFLMKRKVADNQL